VFRHLLTIGTKKTRSVPEPCLFNGLPPEDLKIIAKASLENQALQKIWSFTIFSQSMTSYYFENLGEVIS